MSTPSTVVDPATVDATANGNFITKQETYILVKDGEKNKVFPESDELAEQIEKGEVIEVARQSYLFYEPTNAVGVNELIPNEEEQVILIAKALRQKLQNKARTGMLAKEFEAKDGVIDLREVCNEKSDRRGLSDVQKLARGAAELSPAERAQLLAMLQQLQSAEAA